MGAGGGRVGVGEGSDGFYAAVLGTRQRLLAGVLGVGLGTLVPIGLSVALMATTGDPVFVIFPLPFLGAMWLIQGLAPAGYTLEEGGIRIERRLGSRFLPYDAIQAVDREPRPVGGLFALGVNGLFGAHGVRWNPRTGFHYLAIANTTELVYLHTRRGLIVLSPAEPDVFVDDLRRRLAVAAPAATRAGSDQPVKGGTA
ncbi:MAG: PH domain-containing protein [Candidatus Rokubacteria bacterium]|nr:PH domain-containing protein [Candidatus Rokubacteria bacterium]